MGSSQVKKVCESSPFRFMKWVAYISVGPELGAPGGNSVHCKIARAQFGAANLNCQNLLVIPDGIKTINAACFVLYNRLN